MKKKGSRCLSINFESDFWFLLFLRKGIRVVKVGLYAFANTFKNAFDITDDI